jgi:hypothetical protein
VVTYGIPSETGGWQFGDLDLSEHLSQCRDCAVTLILAATDKVEPERIVWHLWLRDG